MNVEKAEELWDKYSQHIDDKLDSLQTVAGTSIVTRSDFIKAVTEERVFTEKEITDLQSAVHEITGNGKVMQLFNALLGVSAG